MCFCVSLPCLLNVTSSFVLCNLFLVMCLSLWVSLLSLFGVVSFFGPVQVYKCFLLALIYSWSRLHPFLAMFLRFLFSFIVSCFSLFVSSCFVSFCVLTDTGDLVLRDEEEEVLAF